MPTEQEVREQIAESITPIVKHYVLSYIHNLNQLEAELKKRVDYWADQILNEVKARRGGRECPECKGRKTLIYLKGHHQEHEAECCYCYGEGFLPVVEKSILEWILIGMNCKEWEDEQNKH